MNHDKKKALNPGLVATIGLSVFALSLGASSVATASSQSENPYAMLSILNSDQEHEDLLPAEDGQPFADGLGLDPGSSRSLGGTKDANYWIVLDKDQKVCLVSLFLSDNWSTIACVTAGDFQLRGVRSLMYSETDYTEAYLAPGGLSLTGEVPAGLSQLESGLIVGDSRGSDTPLRFESGGRSSKNSGSPTSLSAKVNMPLLHPVDEKTLSE